MNSTLRSTLTPRSRRRRRIKFGALAIGALALSAGPMAPPARAAAPIRGAYFYYYMAVEHLDELKRHGFTTALVDYYEETFTAATLANMREKRVRADLLELDLFVTVNLINKRILSLHTAPERRFRDRRGVVHPNVPCPADTLYWGRLFDEILDPAARTAGHPARLAFDLELYGSDMTHYPAGPCLCLDCKLEYAGYTGRNRPLAEPWIDRLPLGDFEDLEKVERERVCAFLASRFAATARESGPLELAVLDLGRPGPVTAAFLDAAEELGAPLLDFTEATYGEGSAVPHEVLTAPFSGRQIPVGIVGGLWLKPWTPARLEAEAVRLGRREQGYWIFSSFSLSAPPDELPPDYELRAPQAEYWQALARANQALAQEP